MRRTRAKLLIISALLAVAGCSGGNNGNDSPAVAPTAAVRPCGQAAPCPPITLASPGTWPEGDPAGDISLPKIWQTGEGYQLRELFVSGHANVFNYNQAEAEMGENPGDNLVVMHADMPYKTRILVLFPEQKERFNGVVILEMMVAAGGNDNPGVLPASGEFLRREGFVYIGVTTSGDQSIAYLKSGCGGDLPACGERYADLSLEDNGLEYEIISQLASALKSGDPDQSPLPADYNPVELVFVTSFALQARSVITLADQFHQDAIDGYFPQGTAWSRPISGKYKSATGVTGDPQFCGQPESAPYPDCIGSLAPDEPQLRTNLPVPVYQGMTENDVVYNGGFINRHPDEDSSPYASYRLVEVPGTGHFQAALGALEIVPGFRRQDLCSNQPAFRDTPVAAVDAFAAYWQAMILQVRYGRVPPHAARIETDEQGHILRDARGNALGGLRLPEFQLPLASYPQPINVVKPTCKDGETANCLPFAILPSYIGNCLNLGSQVPLTTEELTELYPDRDTYVAEYTAYTRQLVSEGVLLKEDADKRLLGLGTDGVPWLE